MTHDTHADPAMSDFLFQSLSVVCSKCDFLSPPGSKTCALCKTAFANAESQSAPPGLKRADKSPSQSAIPAAQAKNGPLVADSAAPAAVGPTQAASQSAPPATVAQRPAAPIHVPVNPTPAAVAPQAPPAQAQGAGPKFGITIISGPARGQRFRLGVGGIQIGRSKGLILFPDDPYVSALHATLQLRDNKLSVRDENSTSGVYVSITAQEDLTTLGLFSIGQRLFRYLGPIEVTFATPSVYGAPLAPNTKLHAIEEVLVGGRGGRIYSSANKVITLGQVGSEIAFPQEEGIALKHAELAPHDSGAILRDVSNGFGTFVRLQGERSLKAGDRVRIGLHVMQVEQIP